MLFQPSQHPVALWTNFLFTKSTDSFMNTSSVRKQMLVCVCVYYITSLIQINICVLLSFRSSHSVVCNESVKWKMTPQQWGTNQTWKLTRQWRFNILNARTGLSLDKTNDQNYVEIAFSLSRVFPIPSYCFNCLIMVHHYTSTLSDSVSAARKRNLSNRFQGLFIELLPFFPTFAVHLLPVTCNSKYSLVKMNKKKIGSWFLIMSLYKQSSQL